MLTLVLQEQSDAAADHPIHLRLVSLLGLFAILGLCWVLSHDRRAISWR